MSSENESTLSKLVAPHYEPYHLEVMVWTPDIASTLSLIDGDLMALIAYYEDAYYDHKYINETVEVEDKNDLVKVVFKDEPDLEEEGDPDDFTFKFGIYRLGVLTYTLDATYQNTTSAGSSLADSYCVKTDPDAVAWVAV